MVRGVGWGGLGRRLGVAQAPVPGHLLDRPRRRPAEHRRHQLGRRRRRPPSPIGHLERYPQPAREHVVKVDRTLMGHGMHDLGPGVPLGARHGSRQPRVGRGQRHDLLGTRAVASEEQLEQRAVDRRARAPEGV